LPLPFANGWNKLRVRITMVRAVRHEKKHAVHQNYQLERQRAQKKLAHPKLPFGWSALTTERI
jgi:hypothetical protein